MGGEKSGREKKENVMSFRWTGQIDRHAAKEDAKTWDEIPPFFRSQASGLDLLSSSPCTTLDLLFSYLSSPFTPFSNTFSFLVSFLQGEGRERKKKSIEMELSC